MFKNLFKRIKYFIECLWDIYEQPYAKYKGYKHKYITKKEKGCENSEIRDKNSPKSVIKNEYMKSQIVSTITEPQAQPSEFTETKVFLPDCPYCKGKDVVKRGKRKKKYETAQLYFCNHCEKTFTGQGIKGKTYPLRIILEGLSLYNTGFGLEETCRKLKEEFTLEVKSSTLSDWIREFEPICRYSRMRPYALKMYTPNQVISSVHLFHRQVYDFSLHRAKLALVLQEYKHAKFENLREFLEAVQAECPHQFFKEGERASDIKVNFSLDEVILKKKSNFANRMAALALEAVNDNKFRHSTIQKFMLCNDSVTVAVEVPVYIDKWDLEHMQDELGFKIPLKLDKVLTGHIDVLQVRNGVIHILDYKPDAAKGKKRDAVNQLTLYALALSRLTGLRLYDFKCAWFDEHDYFEFYPLHVVCKLKKNLAKDHPDQMKMFEEVKA